VAVEAYGEESPSVTPVENILQGTVAPPSTPYATRDSAPSSLYSEMAGASGQVIHMQSTSKTTATGEVYLDRDIYVTLQPVADLDEGFITGDMTLEPGATADPDPTTTNLVSSVIVESDVDEPGVFDEASSFSDDDGTDGLKPFELSEEHHVEKIPVVAIPTIIATKTFSGLAAETPEKTEPFDTSYDYAVDSSDPAPFKDSSVPLIPVYPKPPTVEVHSPFTDPLKDHVQSYEISPFPSLAPRSSTHTPPIMSIPSGPPYISPSKDLNRPSTSYSWLGALFGPINPTIVEAQRTGWVEISTEIIGEPPVRKSSGRLRRKMREVMTSEHVRIFKMNISNC
jgi:hypothetical protein